MSLFTKKDRPTAEVLTTRIAELEQRAEAIPGELADARSELSRTMATGTDGTEARRRLIELESESAALPEAIASLQAEIREIRAECIESEKATALQAAEKSAGEIRKAHAKAAEAVAAFLSVLDQHAGSANIDLYRYRPHAVPEIDSWITAGAREIAQRFNDKATKARTPQGKQSTDGAGEAYFHDPVTNKMRPLSERGPQPKPEPSVVTLQRRPGDDNAPKSKLPPSMQNVKAPSYVGKK